MEVHKKHSSPPVAEALPTTILVMPVGDRGGVGKSCPMALNPPAGREDPRFWVRMAKQPSYRKRNNKWR